MAEEYYYQLIHWNLLQPNNLYIDQDECKMHDLLRQLACNISREECFIGDVETLRGQNMSKLRRATVVSKKDKVVVPSMDKVEVKVRTFLTVQGTQGIKDKLFKRFPLLRVLVLNYSLVESIPDYIGKLIHLRLLNLDYTGISSLPKSIGSLKNLQILSLKRCDALHSLPSAFTQLCNLRSLSLLGTRINQVPNGIGKLKSLTELEDFPIGDGNYISDVQDGWDLEELSSMSLMRYLELVKLERAAYCSINIVLADKQHLKRLTLGWTQHGEVSYSEEDVTNAEKIFEKLMPPRNLETLVIVRFFGQKYPTWFGTNYLSSLMHLGLKDLVYLGLQICPELRALPRQLGKEVSLKKLVLNVTNSLKAEEHFPLLSGTLVLDECEGLAMVSNLPLVTELQLRGFPNLSHVEGFGSLQQLELGENMQEISSCWVSGLQKQYQQIHGEDLDVYTYYTTVRE